MLPYDYSRCTGSVTKDSGKIKTCESRLYCLRYLALLDDQDTKIDRPISVMSKAKTDCENMIPLETL